MNATAALALVWFLASAVAVGSVRGQTPLASRVDGGDTVNSNRSAEFGATAADHSMRTATPESRHAGSDLLSRLIDVRLYDVSLEEALTEVAAAGDFELAYLKETVDLERRVSIDRKGTTVREALRVVLGGTGLSLIQNGRRQLIVADPTRNVPAGLTRVSLDTVPERLGSFLDPPSMQTGTIVGIVTDSTTGEVMPGATVVIAGTQQGASTGPDGRYTIEGVEAGTYDLRASFIGYVPKLVESVTVVANETVEANFELRPATFELDEVVAIGYGTVQRRDLTGSVGSIDADEVAETQTVDNVAQMLQGRVPGLNAGIATEADGRAALEVRGRNSIQAGNDPLIVVDGIPYHDGDLADINPNDVASIDVLKGASAAAVYGASAAAGVIEITTKRGASGIPTIRFKSSVGLATQGRFVEPYGPEEYIRYRQEAQRRLRPNEPEHYFADPRNLPSGVSVEEWIAMGTGGGEPVEIWLDRLSLSPTEIENYLAGQTIDWHDEVYRSGALRQNYDLSISGSPERVSYYWSLGYVDNEGEYVGQKFKTIRSRLKLTADATDWLEIGLHGQYANRDQGYLGANAGYAVSASPYGDMYRADGSLEWFPHEDGTVRNPFLYTTQSGRRYEWRNHDVLATIFGNVDLPYGLGYQLRWTNNYDFRRSYLFNPSTTPMGEPAGNANRQELSRHSWQLDNIVTWNGSTGVHELDATFLFNVEAHNTWVTTANAEEFPIELLGYGGLPLGAIPLVDSDDSRATGNALMGRLNYRLLDRYLLTVSYRRDGYSAFGERNPYAYFPSAAFAWRISEEPFFGIDAFSDLKLRLSWGQNGNRSIGAYSALQRLGTTKYIYDATTVTGIFANNLANVDLRWEATTQYNAGLDFGLLAGRLSGSVDAYYMSTTDLLLQRSLPDLTGYSNIWSNLGEVVNRGVEASLSASPILTEDVGWIAHLAFSLNRNEIKSLYGTMVPVRDEEGNIIGEREADDRQNNWFIGQALDRIYDYEVLGIWQEDEAEAAAVYGKEPGDFKLRDVNGDGVLTPIEDKVFLGYTEPRFRISLVNDVTYRRFGASVLLNAHVGQYTTHNIHKHSGYIYGRHNRPDHPYWTPENPTNEWARLSSEGESPPFNYWERSSFLRLQSLSLTYRVPERLMGLSADDNLRLFFNAQNVFVLTPFDGDDPETYSHTPRLFTLGVNLGF